MYTKKGYDRGAQTNPLYEAAYVESAEEKKRKKKQNLAALGQALAIQGGK